MLERWPRIPNRPGLEMGSSSDVVADRRPDSLNPVKSLRAPVNGAEQGLLRCQGRTPGHSSGKAHGHGEREDCTEGDVIWARPAEGAELQKKA